MAARRIKGVIALAVFLSFLSAAQVAEQMNTICRFKNITIPVDLSIEGATFTKGAYDLEFVRYPSPILYYLRIMKKGRILKLVQGKEFAYDNASVIPRKPTLKMSKDAAQKTLLIVFESGTDTTIYERVRASYSFPYAGE